VNGWVLNCQTVINKQTKNKCLLLIYFIEAT